MDGVLILYFLRFLWYNSIIVVKGIARLIAKYCYFVFGIFLILTIVCSFLATKVNINRDIYSYMPENSETAQGLTIMKEEFDYGQTSSWQIMVKDLADEKKLEVKEYLESVESVRSVNYDESEEHNKNQDGHDYSLYEVVLDAPADSEGANKAYKEINQGLKAQGYTFYQSGEVNNNNQTVVSISITLLAVGTAMIILTVMSESFVEPWLYLFAILIAVVLNKGTNVIFDNVSYITDSISMVLQMALSMDYAIMLSSRYRQEKKKLKKPNKRLAMDKALEYSFGAISSSSFTTVVGLLALVFMSFTIGRDMGLVLSKGVALSLVSIFTILPAMLLLSDKAIEKTKKKTPSLKLKWLGKSEYRFRKLALPIFAGLFGLALLLKGNAGILFTASENDKVKDVFPLVNQTALVYENSRESAIDEFCRKYERVEVAKRTICYSNTIGEPEKYNEIIKKANELSELKVSGQSAGDGKKVEAEDYLVKAMYYYYFRGDKHTMSLPSFARFARDELINDVNFKDEISDGMRANIVRLSKFVIPEEMEMKRSKDEIASLLGVDTSMLDDLYTLYLFKHPTGIRMTLYEFADFVNREVLTNPEYSGMISAENRENLKKLLIFSDRSRTSVVVTPGELAEMFGLEVSQVESILTYHNYLASAEPTVEASPATLVDFALKNEMIREGLGVDEETAGKILDGISAVREAVEPYTEEYPVLEEIFDVIDAEYSYGDYEELAGTINEYAEKIGGYMETIVRKAEEINEKYELGLDFEGLKGLDLPGKVSSVLSEVLGKIKQIYQVYQTSIMPKEMTPAEFVEFLINHADDEVLSLDEASKEKLKLVQYVISHQGYRYSSYELSRQFGLDAEQLGLVYALYDYRYVSSARMYSLEEVVNFLTDEVFNDAKYADRLSEAEKNKVWTVAGLMQSARMGVPYSYESLYNSLSGLGEELDKNQLFLAYLYHGSIYDYDENWKMSLVTLVGFLNDDVLPDARFASRIDEERRETITDARETIRNAKSVLVGPEHSRVLIETTLPAEGEETFEFLKGVKESLGEGEYYLVGDSAMAYEMSQSFGAENDFITILTMIMIFVVVAFTFKSLLVPLVLVFVIQTAVFINMAYLSLTGQSIYFIALIIVQSILMGATIDYAILYTSYYLEHRVAMGVKRAILASYEKSIHSILTSASILILVTAIVGNMASAIAAKICQSISGGTLVATLIILLLLPALLAGMDRLIVKKAKK